VHPAAFHSVCVEALVSISTAGHIVPGLISTAEESGVECCQDVGSVPSGVHYYRYLISAGGEYSCKPANGRVAVLTSRQPVTPVQSPAQNSKVPHETLQA